MAPFEVDGTCSRDEGAHAQRAGQQGHMPHKKCFNVRRLSPDDLMICCVCPTALLRRPQVRFAAAWKHSSAPEQPAGAHTVSAAAPTTAQPAVQATPEPPLPGPQLQLPEVEEHVRIRLHVRPTPVARRPGVSNNNPLMFRITRKLQTALQTLSVNKGASLTEVAVVWVVVVTWG